MFEQKLTKLPGELGQERFLAAYLATGARNGVEDLHTAGVFSDSEAPAFNEGTRQSLYEPGLLSATV